MAWHNLFIPHRQTHAKAQLLSWHAFAIYLLLFMLLQISFSIVGYTKPGILGISSSIDQEQVIKLTNQERQKQGLSPLKENADLDAAAQAKAQNMFAENYWAHFAPSGKTPWDFITASGYKFVYAGENLAKNFYTSQDVVTAWMNSPSHRENIMNNKYQDIGLAIAEGELNGQKTTLVVQMFGATQDIAVAPVNPPVNQPGEQLGVLEQANNEVKSVSIANDNKLLIDPYQISKYVGLGLIGFIGTLLVIDFIIIRRRGVYHLASHNIAHLSVLSAAAISILQSGPGSIL